MRLTVTHGSREALEIFAREIAPSGTSWAPGTTMPPGARPAAAPLIKQFTCLVPRVEVDIQVTVNGTPVSPWPIIPRVAPDATPAIDPVLSEVKDGSSFVRLPLVAIACARSGDKGDRSNIGVVARRPEFLPLILSQLTAAVVREYFSHLVKGEVRRYTLPGIQACNFVMNGALDGGGSASLRMDPLGKGMAQMLLDLEVDVPVSLAPVRSVTSNSHSPVTT